MADKTGYIGRNPSDSSVVIARQTFEPSGSTTTFTFAAGYTVGYLDLYLNGSRLIEGRDYNANNGTTAVLVSAVTSGDVVEIIAYKAFNLQNTVSESVADFTVGNNVLVGNDARISNDLNVTGIGTVGEGFNVSAGGANISGVVTATSYQGDGSALTGIGATDTIAAASLTVSGITTLANELKVTAGGIEVDGGGGRVICTELHSTGEMSTVDWVRDTRFTFKTLTKSHVKGYLFWAIPTVKHMKKYPLYRKIWKHIAQHRANDIAWRLGESKFDLLGRIYAGIGEPTCWLIGKFVSDKQYNELNLKNWRKA